MGSGVTAAYGRQVQVVVRLHPTHRICALVRRERQTGMIIKIKIPDEENGWFVVDNVSHVVYYKTTWGKIKDADRTRSCMGTDNPDDTVPVLAISAHTIGDETHREDLYVTNMPCYLLNDDGKTIECLW